MKCRCGGEMNPVVPGRYMLEVAQVIEQRMGNPRYSRKSRLRKKFAKLHKARVAFAQRVAALVTLSRKPVFLCKVCGRQDGIMQAIARNLFPIQPMAEGALVCYDRDPDVADMVVSPEGMPPGNYTQREGRCPQPGNRPLTEQEKQQIVENAVKHLAEGKRALLPGQGKTQDR